MQSLTSKQRAQTRHSSTHRASIGLSQKGFPTRRSLPPLHTRALPHLTPPPPLSGPARADTSKAGRGIAGRCPGSREAALTFHFRFADGRQRLLSAARPPGRHLSRHRGDSQSAPGRLPGRGARLRLGERVGAGLWAPGALPRPQLQQRPRLPPARPRSSQPAARLTPPSWPGARPASLLLAAVPLAALQPGVCAATTCRHRSPPSFRPPGRRRLP